MLSFLLPDAASELPRFHAAHSRGRCDLCLVAVERQHVCLVRTRLQGDFAHTSILLSFSARNRPVPLRPEWQQTVNPLL